MKHSILKSLFIISLSIFSIFTHAQPYLVGHRGSFWGVENTAEAFINGALKGYLYLECDIKVTADSVIVVAHDNTTERLGGALTINTSTLEELQTEKYKQTRGNTEYIGKICTLAEYLDICVKYHVFPLIELKWANGINNNDQSGIPALISLIEEKGLREVCIILTSMKPCLEYIRTHYPDIELQLLAWKYSRKNFNWCKRWNIDVDIHHSSINKRIVRKHHNHGLEVNTWTVNNDSTFQKVLHTRCDFITIDKIHF